ncbi:hypothetical protein LJR034_003980 [Caballeronia sp. LjRoot34]|uniref:hypothetical protein n=1 Tax=Caballeronia sp. LjRoot34 TaxID=3342325 RepID=UPI003ECF1F99
MAGALYAKAEEAHGVITQAQRGVPAIPVAAGGSGGRTDQSGVRGWVNYFVPGHARECFSFIKDWVENQAPHGALPEPTGLLLEAVAL